MPGSESRPHANTSCNKIDAQELRHTMRIPQEFHTPRTRDEKIDHTIHDYVDGVLSRRSLVRRLTGLIGGAAAAMALLESEGLAQVNQQSCPAGIKVEENDKAVQWQDR